MLRDDSSMKSSEAYCDTAVATNHGDLDWGWLGEITKDLSNKGRSSDDIQSGNTEEPKKYITRIPRQ